MPEIEAKTKYPLSSGGGLANWSWGAIFYNVVKPLFIKAVSSWEMGKTRINLRVEVLKEITFIKSQVLWGRNPRVLRGVYVKASYRQCVHCCYLQGRTCL